MTSTIYCGECPRALLCIARSTDELLPIAMCNGCRQIFEVEISRSYDTARFAIDEETYMITHNQALVPQIDGLPRVCPRKWILDFAPKGVRDSIVCPACRRNGVTVFIHNQGTGSWRWGHPL